MKRMCAAIFVCCFMAGCSTTRQTHDYKWDTSLKSIADDRYEFSAALHRTVITVTESTRDRTENREHDILNFPTILLNMNDHEQVRVGLENRPPNMESDVLLTNVNGVIMAKYRVMVRDSTGTHESNGRVELTQ